MIGRKFDPRHNYRILRQLKKATAIDTVPDFAGTSSSLALMVLVAALMFCMRTRAAGPDLKSTMRLHSSELQVSLAFDSEGCLLVGGIGSNALVKYDPLGNEIWAFRPNAGHGPADIIALGLNVDNKDNVFVSFHVGQRFIFQGIDFRETSLLMATFDKNGNLISTKFIEGVYGAVGTPASSSDGGFVLAGTVRTAAQHDRLALATTKNPIGLICKMRADGSLSWVRQVKGDAQVNLLAITMDAEGNIFATGTANSRVIGLGGLTLRSDAESTVWLFKVNKDGVVEWGKTASAGAPIAWLLDNHVSLAFSPKSKAIIWVGEFQRPLDFVTPSVVNLGGKDAFIVKFAPSGSVQWVRTIAGSMDQMATRVAVDLFGNIYTTVYFQGSVTVGSRSFTSGGPGDRLLVKHSDDGTMLWVKHLSGISYYSGVSMVFNQLNELVLGLPGSKSLFIDGDEPPNFKSDTALVLNFTSEGWPPRFLHDPEGQVVSQGSDFSLAAGLGPNPLPGFYQWWRDEHLLPGQTNQSLTIANANPSVAGSYYLVARNTAGSVSSGAAHISYSEGLATQIGSHPTLAIFGARGNRYRVESSPEVQLPLPWPIATNFVYGSAPFTWIDLVPVADKRFYRVTHLP